MLLGLAGLDVDQHQCVGAVLVHDRCVQSRKSSIRAATGSALTFFVGSFAINLWNFRSASSLSGPRGCRILRITTLYSPLSLCHHGLEGLAIGPLIE